MTFCEVIRGRIPSCLNAPSTVSQLWEIIDVLWLLCVKRQHIYVEIHGLRLKHYYKSSKVATSSKCNFLWDRSTFCSTFTFNDLYMLNATPLSHLFEFFSCYGTEEIILNHTTNLDLQVIRRPKFPSELKGLHHERHRGDGELLFSCKTNTVLDTLQTGRVPSTGLLCSQDEFNTASTWKNYSRSRKRNFLLRLCQLFSTLPMLLNVPLVSTWGLEQQRMREDTKCAVSLGCILWLYLAQAGQRKSLPVVFARKDQFPLRNHAWAQQACLPKCRRSWNLEMRECVVTASNTEGGSSRETSACAPPSSVGSSRSYSQWFSLLSSLKIFVQDSEKG